MQNKIIQNSDYVTDIVDSVGTGSKLKVLLAERILREQLGIKRRSDGTTAYHHGLRVAHHLVKSRYDISTDVIISALLHDILEDSELHEDEIRNHFGGNVLFTIKEVTRVGDTSRFSRLQKLISKIEQNLKLSDATYHARLIKLSDRLDNLRSMQQIPLNDRRYKKIPYWIIETETSILPIAKETDERLYNEINSELESLKKEFEQEIRYLFNLHRDTILNDPEVGERLHNYM